MYIYYDSSDTTIPVFISPLQIVVHDWNGFKWLKWYYMVLQDWSGFCGSTDITGVGGLKCDRIGCEQQCE